jgi:hypothetical protein
MRRGEEADMFGVITAVPAPIELYDAIHAELRRRTGGKVDGLLVHIGRVTGDGFEVIEVWQSRDHFERYARDVVDPVVAELSHGQAPPTAEGSTPFEVRGLVIPSADMYE